MVDGLNSAPLDIQIFNINSPQLPPWPVYGLMVYVVLDYYRKPQQFVVVIRQNVEKQHVVTETVPNTQLLHVLCV